MLKLYIGHPHAQNYSMLRLHPQFRSLSLYSSFQCVVVYSFVCIDFCQKSTFWYTILCEYLWLLDSRTKMSKRMSDWLIPAEAKITRWFTMKAINQPHESIKKEKPKETVVNEKIIEIAVPNFHVKANYYRCSRKSRYKYQATDRTKPAMVS